MPDDEKKDPEFAGEQNDYEILKSGHTRCCAQLRKLKQGGSGEPGIEAKIASLEKTKTKIEHGLNILQPMSTKKTTFV
jgi:hypothetical protein